MPEPTSVKIGDKEFRADDLEAALERFKEVNDNQDGFVKYGNVVIADDGYDDRYVVLLQVDEIERFDTDKRGPTSQFGVEGLSCGGSRWQPLWSLEEIIETAIEEQSPPTSETGLYLKAKDPWGVVVPLEEIGDSVIAQDGGEGGISVAWDPSVAVLSEGSEHNPEFDVPDGWNVAWCPKDSVEIVDESYLDL